LRKAIIKIMNPEIKTKFSNTAKDFSIFYDTRSVIKQYIELWSL